VVVNRFLLGGALLLAAAALGCTPVSPRVASIAPDTLPAHGAVTVLVFFSPGCHCLAAHDARLVDLYTRYRPRGLELLMIDSETTGSAERDAREAERRGYPFRIVRDPGARLADALGAAYASYAVLLDAQGRVRYHGGIDSDATRLHDDARLYLRDAVDDVLEGRAPRVAEGEALGCALQKW
jgi:hypothetical protein